MTSSSGARQARQQVDVRGCPVFSWQLTPTERRDPVVCRLPPSLLTYHIHANGLIKRLTPSGFDRDAGAGLIKYVYFADDGTRYDLGEQAYNKVAGRGSMVSKPVRLINLNNVTSYSQGSAKFGFQNDSQRPHIGDLTLASLYGAMLAVGYTDISCNGFSHADGSSAPSTSHTNGINGDFKYLRSDKTTQSQRSLHINANPELLDVDRQNAFNEALHRFGWKSMLSWRYRKDGHTHLLAHTAHFADHHHHLHVQGYAPNVVDE